MVVEADTKGKKEVGKLENGKNFGTLKLLLIIESCVRT